MTHPLYMIEMRLDPGALIRFLQAHGANRERDEDLGYGIHAWLAAVFGGIAPKPFRLLHSKGGELRLLGYSPQSGQSLVEHATTFASPLALAPCNPEELCAKRMPNRWEPGRKLGFETLVCPVSRQGKAEKDVLLRRVDRKSADQPFIERETAYRDWLARQFQSCAEIESSKLVSFRLARFLRLTQRKESVPRDAPRIMRPQALMKGVLIVKDDLGFNAVLARGLGRHRAFGYGMVMLRPVS